MRQKSNGTHLILMELMMVLFFFAICGSILLQVFVKAHNISAKAREMTETKNYVTQAAELIEAGAYDIKDFQEYFTQIDGKAGDYQCYFDQDWNEIKKTKARYHMTIKLERQPAKVLGKITMWRENQQIYQLDILRYRQERKDMSEFLKESREYILSGYEKVKAQFPGVFEETDNKIAKQDEETALALKYLYMTMPCSDMGNYPFEIFLAYAQNSVRVWKESEGVRSLP